MPAHGLRDQAAGEQSDRRARGGDEAEDAEGLRPFIRLREEGHDHGQDHCRADGSSDALDEPRADEHRLREREAAQDRGADKDRQAHQEDALAAEEVADPAREKKEAAERDQVRVDDPRQPRLRETQVSLDRRQRDVDDRHVDDDQKEPGAEHDQREPA